MTGGELSDDQLLHLVAEISSVTTSVPFKGPLMAFGPALFRVLR